MGNGMRVKLLTLRFAPSLGGFDDRPLSTASLPIRRGAGGGLSEPGWSGRDREPCQSTA